MLREDFSQPLPMLLREKVRNSIRQAFGSHIIPYNQLTNGEKISLTENKSLKICQDLKLQKHIKRESKQIKQEVGTLCK